MVVEENLGRIMLDVMRYHPRTVWNGSLDQFPFRGQSVHLNAEVGARRLPDTLLDTPQFVLTIHEESEVDDCRQKEHVF
jgi:hypothetical protein